MKTSQLKEVPLSKRIAKQKHNVNIAINKLQREYALLENLFSELEQQTRKENNDLR